MDQIIQLYFRKHHIDLRIVNCTSEMVEYLFEESSFCGVVNLDICVKFFSQIQFIMIKTEFQIILSEIQLSSLI